MEEGLLTFEKKDCMIENIPLTDSHTQVRVRVRLRLGMCVCWGGGGSSSHNCVL